MKVTAKFGKIPTSHFPLTIDRDIDILPDTEKKATNYPNPARDFFIISVKDLSTEPEMVRIIDSFGRIIYEDLLTPGSKIVHIPRFINTGIYFVELLLGSLPFYVQRLVITK